MTAKEPIQPLSGFEWLRQCKDIVGEADFESTESDICKTAVMILFGAFSTDLRVISAYTGYQKDFLRPRMACTRKLGIWGKGYKGGLALDRWFDTENGDWAFWLDAMVVNGDLNCKVVDGEVLYRAAFIK